MAQTWLSDSYQGVLNKIIGVVRDEWSDTHRYRAPSWYTPHDDTHNAAVEAFVRSVCETPLEANSDDPNEMERLILSASAWLHDMGMCPRVYESSPRYSSLNGRKYPNEQAAKNAKDERARKEHHLLSADYIMGKQSLFEGLPSQQPGDNKLAHEVASATSVVSAFHRRHEYLDNCPLTRRVGNFVVRLRLLAAILRLADAAHMSSARVPDQTFNMLLLGQMPFESQFHWLKTFAVSRLVCDKGAKTLHIQIDVPRPETTKVRHWRAASERLAQYLKREIEEELEDITKVMAMYPGFPQYWFVSYEIHAVPGYTSAYSERLLRVLQQRDVGTSPNAGGLVESVLETVHVLCTDENAGEVRKNLEEFARESLGAILRRRPCHAGLRRFEAMLQSFLADPWDDTKLALLREKLEGIRSRMEASGIANSVTHAALVNALSSGGDGKPPFRNVVVYAYSSTVAGVLALLPQEVRDHLHVHVGEARPKSSYALHSRPLYLDGLEYAKVLRRSGIRFVTLVPDVSIGTLLNLSKVPPKDDWIVFFGANGISRADGHFGYSGGHFMIAGLAKQLEIPVWVFTHSSRIGTLLPPTDTQRDTQWFSTYPSVGDDLDLHDIALKNPREEWITREFITTVVTEKGTINTNNAKYADTIEKWAKEWDDLFAVPAATASPGGGGQAPGP